MNSQRTAKHTALHPPAAAAARRLEKTSREAELYIITQNSSRQFPPTSSSRNQMAQINHGLPYGKTAERKWRYRLIIKLPTTDSPCSRRAHNTSSVSVQSFGSLQTARCPVSVLKMCRTFTSSVFFSTRVISSS